MVHLHIPGLSLPLTGLIACRRLLMMRALAAILSDSQDMYETFNENPDAYMSVMNGDLLPIVYRRCNASAE